MGKTRDIEVDVLRSIGILMIIMAHIKAPMSLNVIRCFDVPLMVFVSGLCYSNKTLRGGISKFYSKRILRLIVPTYLFLTFLLLIERIILGALDYHVVLRSFLLFQDGSIGYVWIIKVFLLVMLATPVLIKVVKKSPCYIVYLLMGVLIVAEEYLVHLLNHANNHSICFEAINETIPYLLGYSVFFLLGLLTKKLNEEDERMQLVCISILSIGFMGYWLFRNGNIWITSYKYPPQLLYIIYGCLMPALLWFLRRIFNLNERYELIGPAKQKFIDYLVFLGQNTLWFYLWHILFVIAANHFLTYWPLRFIVVLFMSTIVMVIQYKVIMKIKSKSSWPIWDYFVG